MKITNHGVANANINVKESVQGLRPAGKDGAPGSIMQNFDLYIPSQEWLHIQGLLHQQPEIRNDRVAVAGERLSVGYYLTEDSAQQTAAAMLNSAD
jgi:hypothetical protein